MAKRTLAWSAPTMRACGSPMSGGDLQLCAKNAFPRGRRRVAKGPCGPDTRSIVVHRDFRSVRACSHAQHLRPCNPGVAQNYKKKKG